MSQTLPYFGRAWHIAVDTADNKHLVLSSDQFSEALRVTFAVDMYMRLAYWMAQVTIYNLSNETATQIWKGTPGFGSALGTMLQPGDEMRLGDAVTISAGYQSDGSGKFNPSKSVIYEGRILQPVWLRENVVDSKLILRLSTGLPEDAYNFSSFSLPKGATAYETLIQTCCRATTPIPINEVDGIDDQARAKLSQVKFSRGQAIHGRPYEILRPIISQAGLFAWVNAKGLNVRSFDSAPKTPDYAYGPPDLPGSYAPNGTSQGLVKKTLIGVPEQTQDGAVFRVLLDPSVKIGDTVQLAPGTIINPFPRQIGPLPAAPAVNGQYVVAGIRHVGDTRGHGDDWFTEIHGVVWDFFPNFLLSRSPTGK
jgi:hypothetical protein